MTNAATSATDTLPDDTSAADTSGPATSATTSRAARELARSARPSWRGMFPGIIFGVLSGLSAVLLLGFSAYLITRASEQPPILYLGLLIVGVRGFALARAFFRYIERLSSHDAAFRALGQLRGDTFARLVPLAPARLGKQRRGDLLSRMLGDVDQLVDWPTRVIQPLVSAITVIVLSLAALAFFSPASAAILAGILLVTLVMGTYLQARISARAERRTAGLRGELATEVADLVTDLDILIAFDAVDERLDRLERADVRLRAAALRSSMGEGVTAAVLSLGSGLAVVLMVALNWQNVVGGEPLGPTFVLEPGVIDGPVLAVLALTPIAMFEIFAAIPQAWTARNRTLASAERIAQIAPERPLHEPDSNTSPEEGALAQHTPDTGRLQLRDFTVSWPQPNAGFTPVSAPLSLDVAPGERVLITGPSGSGKTALGYGLVRFVESAGGFCLNGRPAADFTDEQLRRRICLIEQDAHIFDATLRANLAFAAGPETTDETYIRVLEAVGLWGWAQQRSGLDTTLGMFGSEVSGGQAHRIAVARGLLSGAEVLILDEPTAHVDPSMSDDLFRELLTGVGQQGRAPTVLVFSHVPVPPELIDQEIQIQPDVARGV